MNLNNHVMRRNVLSMVVFLPENSFLERRERVMKKKLSAACIVALVVVTLFGGCQGKEESTAAGKKQKILFSIIESGDYYENWAAMAQKEAENEGVQLDVKYAQKSIEEQVKHVKEAVDEGYDAIICSPVSVDIVGELTASAEDIPIVFVNNEPDDKKLKKDKYIYVASDEMTAGEYQAECVLNQLEDKSEINVVILKGTRGSSGTYGRTNGAKRVLEASGKTIHYVFEDYADYNPEKAEEMFRIFLEEGKPVDCVLCNNDNMAVGALEACEKAGVNTKNILFLGVDASEDGCKAVSDGRMALTVFQSTAGQSKAAVDAAVELAKGGTIADIDGAQPDGKHIWIPFEKVDSSNVKKYMTE